VIKVQAMMQGLPLDAIFVERGVSGRMVASPTGEFAADPSQQTQGGAHQKA
jgi:hypothetical protein